MYLKKILFSLVLGLLFCQVTYLQTSNTLEQKSSSLQGEKAFTHLKQTGQFSSLRDAFYESTEGQLEFGNSTPVITETQEFSAANLSVGANFGKSVAISGDYAVISSVSDSNKGIVYIFEKIGNDWVKRRTLSPSDSESFGNSVDIDGEQIIIGAHEESDNGVETGVAYIFARNSNGNWIQQARLIASDREADDYFGFAVSIEGNYAVVGAAGSDGLVNNSGAVYIFRNGGTSWVQSQKISANDGIVSDLFGWSVAIYEQTIAIGAVGADDLGNFSGAAYIFDLNGSSWTQTAKLLANDGEEFDFFGSDVDIDQNTIAVGAYGKGNNENSEGAAYIFVKAANNWRHQAKIVAPDRELEDLFGAKLSLDGDSVLIGSRWDDDGAVGAGSAYLFTRSNGIWTISAKLRANDGRAEDHFGIDVAMDNGKYMIGALDNDDHGKDSGSVYMFATTRGNISQEQLILPIELDHFDRFGTSVAVDGNVALIGVPQDDMNGANSGAVFVFVHDGTEWIAVKKIAGNSQAGDKFGSSVAVDSNFIAIGSINGKTSNTAPNTGVVEMYRIYPNNCLTVFFVCLDDNRILKGIDSVEGDDFGTSVSLDGDTLIVGDPKHTENGTTTGAAYIFTRDGSDWNEQAKFGGNLANDDDAFGFSVGISGDYTIVGSPLDDDNGSSSGAVYIHKRTGTNWIRLTTLRSSDSSQNDRFGHSVAIEGLTVAVGANLNANTNSSIVGTVYSFTEINGAWGNEIKLLPNQDTGNVQFGHSVAIDNDRIIAGAIFGNGNSATAGNAYVFKKSGANWNTTQRIFAGNGHNGSRFGFSVAMSGSEILVGAPFTQLGSFTDDLSENSKNENIGSLDNGAAHFFQIPFNPNPTKFDFDGDSKTDVSIFRPAPGEWWYSRSSDGGNFAVQFGSSTDKLVPADFTGDGKADIAFWRPSTGEWFILRSEDSSFYGFPFGANGDIPAPGDFDGDGIADAAVFRPSQGVWYIQRSSDGGTTIEGFGIPEDKPVVADYDGDGKDDIAIFRPSVSEWWINRSNLGTIAYQFGTSGDKTVQGDYTGDGKADVAIWRPSNGNWLILRSEDTSFYGFPFGSNGDIASPGDYDGDGQIDAAVFRPSNTTWYINGSTSGTQIVGFGINGDIPLPSSYSVP